MPALKPPKDLLRKAAELRVNGSTWEAVARAVNRSADTVRRWPTQYKSIWQNAIKQAEKQLLLEATAESVLTLRRQLRSDDEKSSRDAADKLIRFRLALTKRPARSAKSSARRPPNSDAERIVRYLEELTDAQVDELLAEWRSPVADAERGVASPADPGSSPAT